MKMSRIIGISSLIIFFLVSKLTLLGTTITRDEITQYALTREFCPDWQPLKNVVKLTNDKGETAIFTSNFSLEYTYNYEAYVYGGEDSESGFLGRINGGTCPGGRNMSNLEHSTTWLYKNNYNPAGSLAGIDCSAFVSECWKVTRTNTTGLADMSLALPSKNDLKPGDILDIPEEHVILVLTQAQNDCVNTIEAKSPGIIFTPRRPFGNVARYTPYSIFPQFSDENPKDGEVVDLPEGETTIDIFLTLKASGDINSTGVRMFIQKDGGSKDYIGDATLDKKGDKTWEFKKEDFDVSEGGNFTVYIISRNDIAGNGYRDEYKWEFSVDPAPPIVRSTDPSNSAREVPVNKSPITITFSEPMDPVTTTPAVQTPFACSKSWKSETVIEIIPDNIFDYCSEYTITVTEAATDTSGVHLDGNKDGRAGGDYTFTFTIEQPPIDLTIDPEVANVDKGKSLTPKVLTDGTKLKKEVECKLDFDVWNPGGWSVSGAEDDEFNLPPKEKHENTFTLTNTDATAPPLRISCRIPIKCGIIYSEGYYWTAEAYKNDHPDENQSPGEAQYPTPWLTRTQSSPALSSKLRSDSVLPEGFSDIGILLSGWADGYGHILGRYKIATLPVKPNLQILNHPDIDISDAVKLLVIGSAGLKGFISQEFKQKLEEYVVNGGNLLVFTQKYGDDLSVLPGNIKGYGWNEDQSCFKSAAYLSQWHPVFAGQTKQIMTCNVDGYISEYPNNAEILLGRTKNGMPALLYYSYGAGTVIVSSLYTDWGYGHEQRSSAELSLIRDLTTWALNPDMDIPEFYRGSAISVPVSIKYTANDTSTATTAIIKIYTPDRKLYDSLTVPVSLNSGEEIEWEWSKSSVSSDIGLWIIDYALKDGSGNWIQGYNRGAVFAHKLKVPVGNYALGDFQLWVISNKEEVLNGDTVNFEIFIKNNTDSLFTGKLIIALGHQTIAIDSFLNITLPPDSTIIMNYTRAISATRNWRFGLYESDQYEYAADLKNAIAFNNRGVNVIKEPFSISLSRDKESWYRYVLGIDSVRYKVEVTNEISDSCSPYVNVYALFDSVRYDLWGDTLDIAGGGKEELEGVFFPLDFDTAIGKQQLCCELFYRDSLWKSASTSFELTYPSVRCSLALPDSFSYGDSNLYTVTLTTEGSCLPLGKLLLSGVNYSDSLVIDYSYDSDTTLVFDYQPDVWQIYGSVWLDRLKLQYKYGNKTIEKSKALNFQYPAISAFRPVYTKPQGGFSPGDTAVFKAQLYLKGDLYGVPLEFSLWSDYLGSDTLRDTIILNPTSNRTITLRTYTDMSIPADTMISYDYRMRYLDKEYLPKGELQYFVQSPEAVLHWPLNDTFAIGATIPITFTNDIKAPSRVNIDVVYLRGDDNVGYVIEEFDGPGEVEIPGDSSYTFDITVPHWKSGQYYLDVRSNIVEGRGVNLDLYTHGCPIYIDGIEADIQVSTSKDYYGYGEDIPFSSLLENSKYAWCGSESLSVYRTESVIESGSIWYTATDIFGLLFDGSGFVLDSVYSLEHLGLIGSLSASWALVAEDEWNNFWTFYPLDEGLPHIEKRESPYSYFFDDLILLSDTSLYYAAQDIEVKRGVIYISSYREYGEDGGRLYKFSSTTGEFMGYIEPPNRRFVDLYGIAIKDNGNILALEVGTKTLWEFSNSGDSISALFIPTLDDYCMGDVEYNDGIVYIGNGVNILTVEGTSIDSFCGGGEFEKNRYYNRISIADNGKILAGADCDEGGRGLKVFSPTGDFEAETRPGRFYDLVFYNNDIVLCGGWGSVNIELFREFGKEKGLIRASEFSGAPPRYRFHSYDKFDVQNSGSISYQVLGPDGAYTGEDNLLPLESMIGSDYFPPLYITMEGNYENSPVFYDCLLNFKVYVSDSLIVQNNYPLNLSPFENIFFADTIKDTIPTGDYCVSGDAYSEYPQPISSDWKPFTVIGNNLSLLLNSDKEEGFAGDSFRISPLTINPLPEVKDSLRLIVKGYFGSLDTTYLDTAFMLSAESLDSFPFVIMPEEPLVVRAELVLPSSDTITREFTPIVKSTRLLSLEVSAPDVVDLLPFKPTTEVYNYSFDPLSVEVKRIFSSDTLIDSINLEKYGTYTFVDSFLATNSDTLRVIATTGGEVYTKKKFIDLGIKGIVLLDSLYEVSLDSVMMSGIIRNDGVYTVEGNALFCMVERSRTQMNADFLDLSYPSTPSGYGTQMNADKQDSLMSVSGYGTQMNADFDGEVEDKSRTISEDLRAINLSAKRAVISSVKRVGKDLSLSAFLSQLVRAGIDTSFSAIYLSSGESDTIPIAFDRHTAGNYTLKGFLFADPSSFLLDSTSSAVNVVGNNQVFVDSLIVSENCDSNGAVLLTVVVDNRSYSPFAGNITISSLVSYRDSVIELNAGAKDTLSFILEDPIDEGEYAFTATITEGGYPVSEKIQNLEFHPVYRFDSLPVGLEVATPDSGIMEISVTNIGNAKGERNIRVNLADAISINEDAIIDPATSDTFTTNFLIPEDFPGGEYFADASIFKNLYPEVDTFFNVKVNGLVIQAKDSLDKLVYSVNDTAALSILVENKSQWSGNLLATLQYGELELDTSFILGGMEKGILNTTLNRDTLYLDSSGVYMSDPISSDIYDSVSINWDISLIDSIDIQLRTDSVIGRGSWITLTDSLTYPIFDWTQLKIENTSLTNQWVNSLILNFKPSGSIELDSFPVQEEIIILDVPIDSSEVKLGWGIYYPSGRSIVLDERYVYLSDSMLTIFTDKGRYEISDTVYATLYKNFPDTNYTFCYRVYFSPTEEKRDSFELKDDTTRFSFVIPEWTRSGTYSIDYWVDENGTQIHADFLDLSYPTTQPDNGTQINADFLDLGYPATQLENRTPYGIEVNNEGSSIPQGRHDSTIQPFNNSTAEPERVLQLAKQWVLGKPTISSFGDSAFISGEHLFDVDGITVYFKNARMDTNLYHEGEIAKIRTEISSDIDLTANLNISSTGSVVSDIALDLKKDIPNKFEFDYLIEGCERGMNELYLHLAKDSLISLAGYVLYFDVYVGDTLAPLISVLSEPGNTYSSNRFYELIVRIYEPDASGTPFTDTLYYRIASSGGGYWQSLLAHSIKGDTNKYLLPSQPNGTYIQYHLIARDEFGNLARYPEEGESDFWVLSPLKPTWEVLIYSAAPSAILQWNSPEELVYYHSGLYSDTININETEIATKFTSQYLPARLERIGLDIINEDLIPSSDTLGVSVYTVEDNLLPGTKIDSFEFIDTIAGYEEFNLSVNIPEEGIFVGIKGSSNLNAVLDGFGEGTHTVSRTGGLPWQFLTPGELLIDGLVSHTPSTKLRGPSDIFSFDIFRSTDLLNWTKITSGLTGTSYADTAIRENREYSYKVMVSFENPVDSFFSVSRTIFVDFTPPILDTIMVNKSGESNLIVKAVLKDTSGIAWDSLGYRNNDTVYVISEDSSENNEHFFSINFTGDTLYYYLKAQDLSLIGNTKRYPDIGFYKWWTLAGIAEAIPDSTYLCRMLNLLIERNIEIKYALSKKSNVGIMLFDITGRRVRTLVRENQNAGYYSVPLRASDLPHGVYFLRMQAGDYKKTVKLVKVR